MLLGQKGIKYGLTIPKQKTQQKPTTRGPIKAFAQDDSDEEPGNTVDQQVARQAATKRSDAKVAELHQAALAEDASIFDYDSHFDDIQKQRTAPKQQEKLARKSRYIEGLLDKAKEREREQDIVYERRLLKEREVEDHLFGDKERFVTAAYKKKLEEDKKWLAEEAIREEQEKKDDVKKRGHLGDFYRNLMSNNVAFGTTAKPPASAAAPSEPAALAPKSASSSQQAGSSAQSEDGQWQAARAARERFELANSASAAHVDAAQPGHQDTPNLSRSDVLPTQDTPAGMPRPPGGVSERSAHSSSSGDQPMQNGGPGHSGSPMQRPATSDEPLQRSQPATAAASEPDANAPAEGKEAAGEVADQPVGGAKRTTQDAAAAARERYLARKRKAPADGAG